MAARLLAELAFGSTSDAYKKLVLDQQKAETIFASVPMNRDPSLFEVTAIVKQPEDLPGGAESAGSDDRAIPDQAG